MISLAFMTSYLALMTSHVVFLPFSFRKTNPENTMKIHIHIQSSWAHLHIFFPRWELHYAFDYCWHMHASSTYTQSCVNYFFIQNSTRFLLDQCKVIFLYQFILCLQSSSISIFLSIWKIPDWGPSFPYEDSSSLSNGQGSYDLQQPKPLPLRTLAAGHHHAQAQIVRMTQGTRRCNYEFAT